jgi:CRP/FNR family transcriptional regulator/CRP/FNR family cyclic AMP-dependent transcriptional regulator
MMPLSKALAAVPLFSGLSQEQLEAVADCLQRRSFDERQVIVRRNEPGDALYIIASGKVKVSYPASNGNGDEGETILAVLSPSDFFGELAVLDGEARSADVIALEPTNLLMLTGADVSAIINRYPAIALALLKQLAGRLRRSTEWIRVLSSQDVYGRIAAQLLYLAQTHGYDLPAGEGRLIRLRLTQNDLASLVGASRESVNKAMGYFKNKGYISVDSTHHITVHNEASLKKRSQQ